MKTFDKLQARIKSDLDIEAINFRRTHVGCWQKTGGAMVWLADIKGTRGFTLGSIYPASELLKSKKKLVRSPNRMGDYEIYPD